MEVDNAFPWLLFLCSKVMANLSFFFAVSLSLIFTKLPHLQRCSHCGLNKKPEYENSTRRVNYQPPDQSLRKVSLRLQLQVY